MLSALKNFGVTFLISALLFGVIAYFATLFVSSTVNSILDDESNELNDIISSEGLPPEEDEEQETTPGVLPEELPEGESFNFLLVVTDYRPDLYDNYRPSAETVSAIAQGLENAVPTIGLLSADFREISATAIVLVRADRDKQQFVYTYFTPGMQVYTPGGFRTLSEVYRLYGIANLAESVNAMTGLKIHYTAVLDGYHLDELAQLLGPVTVTLPRDIYSDGNEYNMNYETLAERIGNDGYPWTEHIPNTWIMGAGENELDGEKLYTLSIVKDHTEADRDAKQKYTVDIVRAYIEKLTGEGEDAGRILFEQLVTERSGWIRIEGYEPTEEELAAMNPEPEAQAPADGGEEPAPEEPAPVDPDLPFDPTPMDNPGVPGGQGGGEGGEEPDDAPETEEETGPLWIMPLCEPETCILSTDCTTDAFVSRFEMLDAADDFESIVITYPCTYIPATEDKSEFYTVRLKDGLDTFLPYRTSGSADGTGS